MLPRCQLSLNQLAVGPWSENRCEYAGIVHIYLHIFVYVGPWVHALLLMGVHNCVCACAFAHTTMCCVTHMCARGTSLSVWHAGAHTEGAKESFVWVQSASDVLEEMYAHLACVTILQSSLGSTPSPALQPYFPEHAHNTGLSWAHPIHPITSLSLTSFPLPRRWFLLPTVFWDLPFPPQSRLSSIFSLEPVLIPPSSLLVACSADSTQAVLGSRHWPYWLMPFHGC